MYVLYRLIGRLFMNGQRLRFGAVTSGHWRRSDGTRQLTY